MPKGLKIPLFSSDDGQLQKRGYIIASDLGEGTYSKVKSAVWQKPGEKQPLKVAIKIINRKTAPKDFLEKFLPRELEILQLLNHKNIVRAYEIININTKTYISLEWAGHGDLLQYVRLKGALKESECRKFFIDLVEALEYCHAINIVHRDLKCENVLLSKKNQVKLADFGFARKLSPTELSKTFCGSAAYAAPELLQGIPYIGTIADIWSCGVILYIMACSSMPYRDSNIKTLLLDQRAPLHIPSAVRGTISQSILDFLAKILVFNPSKRSVFAELKALPWYNGAAEVQGAPKAQIANQQQNENSAAASVSN